MPANALTILGAYLPIHLHSLEADALWLIPLLNMLSIVVIAMVLIWSLIQTFNHNPPAHFMRIWGQLILLWLAPTMPWWALLVVVALVAKTMPVMLGILLLVTIGLYFYSVCIVPNQLRTRTMTVSNSDEPNNKSSNDKSDSIQSTISEPDAETTKVIVVSNIRLGLFSHPSRINRLVRNINELDADCVLVLGEWLYNPPADLVGRLMQIRAINKPIYAIQGAHDNRYVPDNADQFLHEDDLNHAFDSLDIIEVNDITQTLNGLTLVAKPTKFCNLDKKADSPTNQVQSLHKNRRYPAIALCNSLSQMQYCLTTLKNANNADLPSEPSSNTSKNELKDRQFTLVLFPDDSKAFKSNQLSEQALAHNALIKKIPSFGRRGLPFRFNKPSITLLHINVK